MDKYKKLLDDLYPLRRTLVSDDMDAALQLIMDFLKQLGLGEKDCLLHKFPSGEELSTWIVPQKYSCKRYLLTEILDGKERVIIDEKDIPLSIAEYSESVDDIFRWDEIKDHLFYSEARPNDIPFVYKFFYRKNFGFCLPKKKYDTLNKKAKFRAVIESELKDDFLKCLEVVILGKRKESILVMSNVCHPYQVNDSITGVINNLKLIETFAQQENEYTLRFGFWPETIGAQAYFTKYYEEKELFKYAIFTEMLGTDGKHALQFSRQENTLIDRVAQYVLKQKKLDFYTGGYLTLLRNDERTSNGCNLDIPTISLSRWPYPEYHTSADNPSIINYENLNESFEVTKRIVDILCANETLKPSFFGQPFLTRYGLFHEYSESADSFLLNRIQEDVYSYSDGTTSLFEIADRFDYDWDVLLEQANRLKKAKLLINAEG